MQTGRKIGDRFELTEFIGRGGMAEVWRARDLRLDRDVALKFLDPRLAGDPEFLVRFFSEAQAVASISHGSVVSVLDFGQADERPYLVMEFVEGGSLSDLAGRAIDVHRAIEIVAEVAEGAGAAHKNNLVHRDIKPPNILLDSTDRAKLADFGIASVSSGERLTATGAAIGSPYYISPEQVSGGDASPASDVYSLGVVLYELLTGQKPFDADNITAVAIAHVENEPDPPSARNAGIEPGIDEIVLRCLAKAPEERFADGAALAGALRQAQVEHAPVAAGEGGSSRRRPRADLVGGLVLIALLGLTAAGLVAADSREPRAEAAPVPSSSASRASSPSPSPSDEPVSSATEPSPSPTERQREKERKEKGKSSPAGQGTKPEPDPTPSEAPSPEPSATGAPAENPSPSP